MSFLQSTSHRRFNPLTGEWVLVSPHRTRRPWQGRTETPSASSLPTYDPECYLCPGNSRAGGVVNPDYAHTLVFDNDFSALEAGAGTESVNTGGLIVAETESGICRVICFSPRHDLTLARMGVADIGRVVGVWAAETVELGGRDGVAAVHIFENRGEMIGASNPHPHCQVWATQSLTNEMEKELRGQTRYHHENSRCLLCDYLALELEAGERVLFANDHFVALVPFWAVWPFETMVLPRRHIGSLDGLTAEEVNGLAEALSQLTIRYDNLFETPFPYSMGFHQKPTDAEAHPEWHLHAHFYPPLLRSATVRKFMVGFEQLGSPQRDLTAEAAAARLRELPATHYLDAAP